ncbi:MAG: D-glycero-beta-D-manno-heptose-7-phosphate kinase [Sulfuricaulis sp.]|uniref:D-glycero-beta-D-manno-heptose-7-phosphate kinase n=1 Tax=Sulfuricaulis sp. TaxID=2003553 RepID=UPI0034A59764
MITGQRIPKRTRRNVLPQLLEKIARVRVLVAGDVMLDRYWYGDVERISPEAPVPVVAVTQADERPGGAANVAQNVRTLGAHCSLFSICGDDREADNLERLLGQADIDCRLHRDKLLNTTVKLRVISRHQQLIRIDFDSPVSKDARVKLLDTYLKHLPEHDAVIVSDYGKGGLGYIQEMIQAARAASRPVVVDPKGDEYSGYRGASLITPNRKEFERVAGRFHDDRDLEKKGIAMARDLDLAGVLVTRGEQGMSLMMQDGKVIHIPARAREVFDVTGAGDTVIAAIGCAWAVGSKMEDALQLANMAAGIVVGKLGAATASPAEIIHELSTQEA